MKLLRQPDTCISRSNASKMFLIFKADARGPRMVCKT